MMQARTTLDLLLFDTDNSQIQIFKDFLATDRMHRFQITTCRNASQTFESLENRDSDLLFVSLESGADILSEEALMGIRRNWPALPVCTYGSSKQEDAANRALERGASDYILLDLISPRLLQKTVHKLLEHRRIKELETYIQRLRHTEESFQKIIRHNRDGIVVVDRNNTVLFLNPMAETMLATPALQMIGKTSPHSLAKEDSIQLDLKAEDQPLLSVHVQTLPIQWDQKEAYLASFRDISDRIKLERRKDDFLNTVSHELRTPLTVIREGLSQVLEGLHGPTTENQQTFLNLSLQSSKQLQKIVDDLLDVAKLEEGKVRLDITTVDLCELVRDTVLSLQHIAKKKDLSLTSRMEQNSLPILADRDRFVQVLNNLINNAIKFTEKGGITLEVKEIKGRVEISVSDTGRGISPLDLPKVFSKFEQFGKKSEDGTKGTGLGLSICKRLIELHDGSISVKSDLGQGTTFTLVLPKQNICDVYLRRIEKEIEAAATTHDSFSLICCLGIETLNDASLPKPEDMIRVGYDVVYQGNHEIYILLPGTHKNGATIVAERIRALCKAHPFLRQIVIRMATYPEDGQTADILFGKVTETMKGDTYETQNSHR